jgi:hypothetical protein
MQNGGLWIALPAGGMPNVIDVLLVTDIELRPTDNVPRKRRRR